MPEVVFSLRIVIILLAVIVACHFLEATIAIRKAHDSSKQRRASGLIQQSQIEILHNDGRKIGMRPMGHKDIREALETPGLKIRLPNGQIEEGVQ